MSGDLSPQAAQGVLFLNSTLTVTEGQPNSHKDLGWCNFTDEVIKIISRQLDGVVFVLWGNYAQSKKIFIDRQDKHKILFGAHPSPRNEGRGFLGRKYFSQINDYLKKQGKTPISWD
jgi:uracil-DNA glycosylase